jgi:hypothetical protein
MKKLVMIASLVAMTSMPVSFALANTGTKQVKKVEVESKSTTEATAPVAEKDAAVKTVKPAKTTKATTTVTPETGSKTTTETNTKKGL